MAAAWAMMPCREAAHETNWLNPSFLFRHIMRNGI
jgi:hypothetical protein